MTFPNRQLKQLTGPVGPVHCVTYSAGLGQYVLAGGEDRSIRLYNPGNGTLIQKYDAHGYKVLDVAVTDDNARFASVGGDKQVFLWDVASGRTTRRFAGHYSQVNCCGFGGEGSVLVTGSFDVRLWDCKSQATQPIQIFKESGDNVSSLHVVGHEIVTGSVDGRMRLYDLRMGQVYVDVLGPPITSVRQTRDGNAVLVSTLDSTIRLMDKGNGNLLQSYKGHVNEEYRIRSCLGVGDAYVVSGSEDGHIYVWDLLEGRVVEKLKAHNGKVASAVAFNTVRKEWLSAGVDGTVTVWGMP
ncbi:MAG: hypothetical protein M1827_000312 [Pycnora praestabilis]|nr:MAG: hypothetical protein M1827_000312 [Pycnora praestabilis]